MDEQIQPEFSGFIDMPGGYVPRAGSAYEGVKMLKHEHMRMVDLILDGHSQAEIAREMEYAPNTVSLIVNQPLFQNELAVRRKQRQKVLDLASMQPRDQAAEILYDALPAAAHELQRIALGGDNDKVRLAGIKEIFDRTYGKSIERSVSVTANLSINTDKLKELESILDEDLESRVPEESVESVI